MDGRAIGVLGALLSGCARVALAPGDGPVDATGTPTDEGQAPTDPAAVTDTLVAAVTGLWTGPATDTRLGAFPLMNVDLRAADAHTIWGRTDIDPDNALRFALEIEDRGQGPEWIYRNGGYFLGMLRDDRTRLVEADLSAGTYRFCDVSRGCDYIDASWMFDGDDLVLDVLVRGQPHLTWSAHRAEPRPAPAGFPDPAPLAADAPLPTLPTLTVTVSWSTPLEAEADVWVLLATEPCADLGCVPSRASRAVAGPGATEVAVVLPEIHRGDYLATAALDRDRDLATTLRPEPSDGLSLPDRPVTVPATGLQAAAALRIALGG